MWQHPDHEGLYFSNYEQIGIDRKFYLMPENGQGEVFTFQSWQHAKRSGWNRVKRDYFSKKITE